LEGFRASDDQSAIVAPRNAQVVVWEMGRAHDCETPGSACLLLEIRWQKGRQADRMCTCTHSLPTFGAAPSYFLSLPTTQFDKKHIHTWETPILVACP